LIVIHVTVVVADQAHPGWVFTSNARPACPNAATDVLVGDKE
jgi:hypothetical protein